MGDAGRGAFDRTAGKEDALAFGGRTAGRDAEGGDFASPLAEPGVEWQDDRVADVGVDRAGDGGSAGGKVVAFADGVYGGGDARFEDAAGGDLLGG